jgi:hypothetical protein
VQSDGKRKLSAFFCTQARMDDVFRKNALQNVLQKCFTPNILHQAHKRKEK